MTEDLDRQCRESAKKYRFLRDEVRARFTASRGDAFESWCQSIDQLKRETSRRES